jgi:hypothetical protein
MVEAAQKVPAPATVVTPVKDAVTYLPNAPEGNPGVQGWVHRPHQEKNPGGTLALRARDKDEFQQKVTQDKETRARQSEAAREAAKARGEAVAESAGPVRLRVHVDLAAHGAVDEDKVASIAQAADALVEALRAAGLEPSKANAGASAL